MSRRPPLTIRTAEQHAIAAALRGDGDEFARLSLDVAGARNVLASLPAIRARLAAKAETRRAARAM